MARHRASAGFCQLSAGKLGCQRLPAFAVLRRGRPTGKLSVDDQRSEIGDRRSLVGGQRTGVSGQSTEEIMQIESAKNLDVYKLANEFAMEIFEITKRFPSEEKYALTSQIRRSSRSVCLNLREAWAKRRYAAHFLSKLTDCDGENAETDSSLDFARQCGYISPEQHHALTEKCAEIGRMLGGMIKKSESFLTSG
jgi:four helix bundle protein